jgi:hypothetical protein
MMFSKRNLMAMGVAAALMAEAGEGDAGGGTEKKKRAPKTNLLDIVRGRLPLALVYVIRFNEKGTNAEVAKKYGTSVGKVFDIRKNRNFEYVTADYKPTKEDLAAAEKWADEAGKHGGDSDGIKLAVAELSEADEEHAKKQSEAMTAARGKNRKGNTKKSGSTADETAASADASSLIS